MAITVQNISSSSARVSWPSAPNCLDTFYSVMYHPNWNSLLMGYTRKSFLREERIPVSHTSTSLVNLTPQTTYILCVTCQAANPVRNQCQVFSTLGEGGGGQDGSGWQLAIGVWMASSILLMVIAGVLLWGCLHSICPFPSRSNDGYPSSTTLPQGNQGSQGSPGCQYTPSSSEEDSKQATVIENPFHSNQAPGPRDSQGPGHRDTQGHELKTMSQHTDGQPV